MTYAQIEESCGVTRPTATKYTRELCDDGEINILRKNENRSHGCKKLPNIYQSINSNIRVNNNEGYIIKKEIEDLDKEYNNTLVNLFSKNEIKELIPDKQYRDICKLYVA
jgi:predicted transcriptional regulator